MDPKASTGSTRTLACNVAIKKDGEVIAHNVGSGGVLRVVPPKKAPPAKVAAKSK